ncbi:hypothetical protein NDU88_005385 [Pleurodeles waltl]|uniref:Uncharacterized protein n=1 Tax=Pleurodeles waltl TaxID=8319 RepID=A0AAV7VJU3_PLEWA|nr:hypothetical protein NDU88_005385 [Pleurodeles waltl]
MLPSWPLSLKQLPLPESLDQCPCVGPGLTHTEDLVNLFSRSALREQAGEGHAFDSHWAGQECLLPHAACLRSHEAADAPLRGWARGGRARASPGEPSAPLDHDAAMTPIRRQNCASKRVMSDHRRHPHWTVVQS